MTGFSRSPRLVRGGIVLVDPTSGAVLNIISMQYNPDTVTRSFQVQAVGDNADRSFPLRLKAPPVETIKVDAELDAADQLEFPDRFPDVGRVGIHPQLALLESLACPTVSQLVATDRKAAAGTLEIAPMESPLSVFVWSASRIVPVRLTDLSVTEEAFDPHLNPLRAKVSLGMRVLTVNDVGYTHRAGTLYLAHQSRKERLAAQAAGGTFSGLGIGGLT
ncbi:MAG TPA: hypothetical protein VGO92_03750 [Acidimicrobiales bacterium]|jgi:hypothetical protein|nr:hypothetical protein [Acidimicrobiales bacterium]